MQPTATGVELGSTGSRRLGELLKAHGVIRTLEEAWGVCAAVLDLEPVKSLLL